MELISCRAEKKRNLISCAWKYAAQVNLSEKEKKRKEKQRQSAPEHHTQQQEESKGRRRCIDIDLAQI